MKNVIRKAAAPTLLALAFISTSAWAQTAAPAAPDAATPPPVVPHAMHHHAKHAKRADFVDQRLNTLHSQLKITADQSSQWDAFAQAMRDSAEKAQAAYKDRADKLPNENADEAMKSYAAITQMHADNTQKLSTAFSPLYASLSDSQKKTADTLFRERPGQHHSPRKHRMHPAKPDANSGAPQDPSAKGMPPPAPAQ